VITAEETAREKGRLPRGWGRFGKSIDALVEVSEPDESLLAACVGLNPTFKHRSITLAGGLMELTQSTNVVLGVTNRRLIVLSTGAAGKARKGAASIPLDGLEVTEAKKKELLVRWPEGDMRVKGCAKQMLPAVVDALRSPPG
jgi:hypothetical protein